MTTANTISEVIGAVLDERKLFIVRPQHPTMGEVALEAYGFGKACDAVALQGDDLQALLLEIGARCAAILQSTSVSRGEQTSGMDSSGRLIIVGDRVRWRGQLYTIKTFGANDGRFGTRTITFEEPLHINDEIPDEFGVDILHRHSPAEVVNVEVSAR